MKTIKYFLFIFFLAIVIYGIYRLAYRGLGVAGKVAQLKTANNAVNSINKFV